MSSIQYPNKVRPGTDSSVRGLDNHGSRGFHLEEDINLSNDYYRETGKGLIYKKPTPIQVVRVDYPRRQRAKITEAYYKTPSTTDYNGVYRGKYIDFEAKETKHKTSFPKYLIHPHQIRHLEQVLKHGGIGFFIIRFSSLHLTYLCDAGALIAQWKTSEHQSIPYGWFAQNGRPIQEGLYPRLHYLKAVDEQYFERSSRDE